jgi:hypothetical protein
MNTNNENNSINATPEQGVIPFPHSSTSSPILVNVDQIDFGGTDSSETTSLIPPQYKDMILNVTNDMIEKIKITCLSITECRNNMDHWKKREFENALKVGEYLVTLRSTNPDIESRFKKFVETEFVNEFCYKTATRYMTLYSRKSEIPSDISTLRKAYISLGILKEEYQDPKDESEEDDTVVSVPNQSIPVNQSNPKKVGPTIKRKVSITDLRDTYFGSFIIRVNHRGEKRCGIIYKYINQYMVSLLGSYESLEMTPEIEMIVLDQLKSQVEWYNQIKLKHDQTKFNQSPRNDGPDLKIAA